MLQQNDQSQALHIAVIGVGSVGSAFSFQLAQVGGHQVTVVARPSSLRLEQLTRDKAIVTTAGERAAVEVAGTLNESAAYDLVLVTLLAHQVDSVLPLLQRSAAKAILFMFNNFEPEILKEAMGEKQSYFGMPFIQARLDTDGRCKYEIGAAGQKSKLDDQRWVDVFSSAGLPAVLEPKMLLWLRCHVPLGAAFESVCFTGMQRDGGCPWRDCVTVARGSRESWTLIKKLGYAVYPVGKAMLHASPTWLLATLLWSMSRVRSFRELLATGANECHALIDALVARASSTQGLVSPDLIADMKPRDWRTRSALNHE